MQICGRISNALDFIGEPCYKVAYPPWHVWLPPCKCVVSSFFVCDNSTLMWILGRMWAEKMGPRWTHLMGRFATFGKLMGWGATIGDAIWKNMEVIFMHGHQQLPLLAKLPRTIKGKIIPCCGVSDAKVMVKMKHLIWHQMSWHNSSWKCFPSQNWKFTHTSFTILKSYWTNLHLQASQPLRVVLDYVTSVGFFLWDFFFLLCTRSPIKVPSCCSFYFVARCLPFLENMFSIVIFL